MVLLVATNNAETPASQIAPPQYDVVAAMQAAVDWKHRIAREKADYTTYRYFYRRHNTCYRIITTVEEKGRDGD